MRFPSVLLLCGILAAAPALSAQQSNPPAPQPNTPTPAQTKPTPSQNPQAKTTPAKTTPAKTTPAKTTPGKATQNKTNQSTASGQSAAKSTAPALHLESLPPLPRSLTPAQQKALRARHIMAAINHLARDQANWGPAASTPGDSLTLIDKGQKSSPEGTQVVFTLHATGFQPGDAFRLLRWPLDSPVKQISSGLTVDGSGQVICPEISQGNCLTTMQPGDPVQVKDIAARGEPLRLAIVSAGSKKRAETTVVPFPIEDTSGACKIEVVLGTKNASLVLIEGAGFPPSSRIKLHVVSYGQDHPAAATTNARGGLIVAILPAVAGHPAGTTTVSYKGGACSPSVSFPWGKNSYHPL